MLGRINPVYGTAVHGRLSTRRQATTTTSDKHDDDTETYYEASWYNGWQNDDWQQDDEAYWQGDEECEHLGLTARPADAVG